LIAELQLHLTVEGMAIMLTGGSGYVGSHLRAALDTRGQQHHAFGSLPIDQPQSFGAFDLVTAGMNEIVRELRIVGADSLVHLAAVSRTHEAEADPAYAWELNVEVTARLLEACRRAGVRRFVFASSVLVYGPNDGRPLDEHEPCDPRGVYARTKHAAEQLVVAAHSGDLHTTTLRFTSLIGPTRDGCLPYGVISSMVRSRRDGLPFSPSPAATDDGTAVRDFLDVRDAVGAICASLLVPRTAASAELFNVASGTPRSLGSIDAHLQEVYGNVAVPGENASVHDPVAELVPDATRIRAVLGWGPRVGFDVSIEGLMHTH
jgi:nucleoside-diphosphate-sugar epimerase